ncbi:MAG: response regulator transcription factor [Candidatus Promineofilum sp.]|nr:response regulator transcription factor [Promineifilum sp.]
MEPIRVLICDDHNAFRQGLRTMLATEPILHVIGEAIDGQQAITQAAELQPDVILMDLQMPRLNGLEATRRIVTAAPHMRILVLTMSDDTATVFHALQAGALGYILKGARKADIVRSIQNVYHGEVVFGAAVAQHVISHFSRVQADVHADAFPQLSERESEILNLMAQELSNEAIAERLGINLKTVRNHVSNICTKLQVSDRTAAVLRAQGKSGRA